MKNKRQGMLKDIKYNQHILTRGRPPYQISDPLGSQPHSVMIPMALEIKWRAYQTQYPETKFAILVRDLLNDYFDRLMEHQQQVTTFTPPEGKQAPSRPIVANTQSTTQFPASIQASEAEDEG